MLKGVQGSEFWQELNALTTKGVVFHRSSISRLLPFLDSDGMLRVGGRLENFQLSESEKHPIILPSRHVFNLIIKKARLLTLHGGPALMPNLINFGLYEDAIKFIKLSGIPSNVLDITLKLLNNKCFSWART